MRKLLLVGSMIVATLLTTAIAVTACGQGSAEGTTTTSPIVASTTTTVAPTTTAAPTTTTPPATTTTTVSPLDEDSWYDIPFYEGATDIKTLENALTYKVAARVQTVHEYYLEIMEDLGYTLWTDALGGPHKMSVFDKDGTRTTISMIPPTGGDGTEQLCRVLLERETIVAPSTTTSSSTVTTEDVFTTTTLKTYKGSWHDIPIMKGASDGMGDDSMVFFTIEEYVQAVDEFYAGVMEDLGYTVVSRLPVGMLSSTVYEKNGVQTTITAVPDPMGGGTATVTMER